MNTFERDHKEMPREKARKLGISALSDGELLALLLDTGTKKENVVLTSERLLEEKGGLKGIFLGEEKYLYTKGVKEGKAYRLMAVKEILRRLPLEETKSLSSINDALTLLTPFFLGRKTELLLAVFLDRNRCIISKDSYDFGEKGKVILPLSRIVHNALLVNASFVLVAHNHPSGNPLPSEEDKKGIQRLSQRLSLGEVLLLDALILSDQGYFSFREEKLPPFGE